MARVLFLLYSFLIFLFVLFPFAILFFLSFHQNPNFGDQAQWVLNNYVFFFEKSYLTIFFKSISMATKTAFFVFLIAYPLSFFLSTLKGALKRILFLVIIFPLWINQILLIYSWIIILGNQGILKNLLTPLGIPFGNVLYSENAVLIGFIHLFSPFFIMVVYNSLEEIHRKKYFEASSDLGATPLQNFLSITFPLSLPAVLSGSLLVFIPSSTTFLVSNLLGGSKTLLFGNLLEKQFTTLGNWNAGSALTMIMIVFLLGFLFLFKILFTVLQFLVPLLFSMLSRRFLPRRGSV